MALQPPARGWITLAPSAPPEPASRPPPSGVSAHGGVQQALQSRAAPHKPAVQADKSLQTERQLANGCGGHKAIGAPYLPVCPSSHTLGALPAPTPKYASTPGRSVRARCTTTARRPSAVSSCGMRRRHAGEHYGSVVWREEREEGSRRGIKWRDAEDRQYLYGSIGDLILGTPQDPAAPNPAPADPIASLAIHTETPHFHIHLLSPSPNS
jgi:hypothetical protein